MKRIIFNLLGVVLSVFLLSAQDVRASGQSYDATISKVSKLIEKRMAEEKTIGMSVALVDEGSVVWAKGFGYADLEKGLKATPETFYEIGSCSKTIAALAIMTLVEEGRVDLDSPIANYLPGFTIRQRFPGSGPITLRTIMTHHSGIPGDIYDRAFDLTFQPEAYRHIMELLREEYTTFPTNFVWSYSNTAVSLEGAVIESITGRPFVEFGDALLRKIGMKESSWMPRPVFEGRRSRGYYEGKLLPDSYINIAPAGSVISNVLEMSEYIRMMLAKGSGVVRPETIETMLTRQNADIPLDLDQSQGLAWVLNDPKLSHGGRVCWHTGGSMGNTSRLEILMDQGLGAIAITNSTTGTAAADEAVHELLRSALEEKKGLKAPLLSKPVFAKAVVWPSGKLKAVAGVYITRFGYDIFSARAGGLLWKRWRPDEDKKGKTTKQEYIKLVPRENGYFSRPDSQDEELEFTRVSDRDVVIIHAKGSKGLLGEKYAAAPEPAAWSKRFGKYDIANLPRDSLNAKMPPRFQYKAKAFSLNKSKGMLILSVTDTWGRSDLVIEPVSDTLAFIRGFGNGKGDSLQIVSNKGKELIRYKGSLYEKAKR